MRISDWSSDVCSSDLVRFKLPFGQSQFRIELLDRAPGHRDLHILRKGAGRRAAALQSANTVGIIPAHPDAGGDAAGKAKEPAVLVAACRAGLACHRPSDLGRATGAGIDGGLQQEIGRAQSELQSLMRISYAVFCLKKQ